MICTPYYISDSRIPHAGLGLYIRAPISAGKVIVAPSRIESTVSLKQLLDESQDYPLHSSVRWFEDQCTLASDWPDECYLNHSFQPNALWHLGFVFALEDLAADAEITVDYRHLLAPGVDIGFADSLTGQRIVGFSWSQSLHQSATHLARLFAHETKPLVCPATL